MSPRGYLAADLIYTRCLALRRARMSGPGATPIPVAMARTIASWWQEIDEDGAMDGFAVYAAHGVVSPRFRADYEAVAMSRDIVDTDRIALAAMWHCAVTPRRETEED